MGLSKDIEDALMKSLGDNISEDVDRGNVPKMAKGIATAIIDFLQKQTFTIVDMKAVVQMEEIETAGPLSAHVLPGKVKSQGVGNTGVPVVSNTIKGDGGVQIPAISLKRQRGQGGSMSSKGYAYIGNNPISTSEKNDKHKKTKVKLLKIEKGTK